MELEAENWRLCSTTSVRVQSFGLPSSVPIVDDPLLAGGLRNHAARDKAKWLPSQLPEERKMRTGDFVVQL